MKILTYSSYYKPYTSGLARYLERVVDDLGKDNDVVVLTFAHAPGLPERETEGRVRVRRMPYLFKVSKGFISPQSLWYYGAELRGTSAVIVNVPNAEALPLVLFARLFRKRVVVIYHCDIDLGRGIFSRIVKSVLDVSISVQLNAADSIVACPDYIEYRSFYNRLKGKITESIPPIIEASPDSAFLNNLKTRKGTNTWVGFVGRIAREKGIEYLIDALKKINDKTYKLVLVTPKETAGENTYRAKIFNRLEHSNINYEILTDLSDAELASVYETLDVLVLPSVNSTEAFGMVQAEAMLHGAPCVTTDLPGVRLPVTLTKCGVLVPPADPSQLAREIRAIVEAPFKRSEVMQKARSVFNAKKVHEVYRKLLSGDK